MKRLLISFSLCIVLVCSTVSCGTIPTGISPVTDDAVTTAESVTDPAVPSFDADAAYADILSECYQLLTAPAGNTEYPDALFGIYETAMMLGVKAADTIGYVFRDLNEDAIPELLIGAFDKSDDAYTKNEIYAAYTYDGQKPVLLFAGWARNAYALTEDNTFYHHGSGGAAYAIFGEYAVSETGDFLCQNAYFTYPKEPDMTEIGFYRNTSGIMDPAQAEEWAVSADEFWAVDEALAAKTMALSAVPFSAYAASDANPA
ncbi:MAG: hypothetical protein IKV66_03240 [Clostridia bacterium]|nr:hypothetical protein [Clostridia bacterium]